MSGEYEAYKKKKAAGEKERRDRINNGLEQLPKAVREKTKRLNREYCRKKVAEYRRRKKGFSVETTANNVPSSTRPSKPESAYNTPSALSKAFAKVKRALPSTAAKKREVVDKLSRTFGTNGGLKVVENTDAESKSSKGVSPSDIEMIKSFYERDDISRMSPNMKDCRKFVNPITGCKEMKQIRHLMYTLKDVFSMFVRYVQNGKQLSVKVISDPAS